MQKSVCLCKEEMCGDQKEKVTTIISLIIISHLNICRKKRGDVM